MESCSLANFLKYHLHLDFSSKIHFFFKFFGFRRRKHFPAPALESVLSHILEMVQFLKSVIVNLIKSDQERMIQSTFVQPTLHVLEDTKQWNFLPPKNGNLCQVIFFTSKFIRCFALTIVLQVWKCTRARIFPEAVI